MRPIESDRFVQSVGVVTHPDYGNWYQNYSTTYGAPAGTPASRTWKKLLVDLGVRWHRAGLKPWADRDAFGIYQINDLWATAGIQALMVAGDPDNYTWNLENLLTNTYDPGALLALEGSNEPDHFFWQRCNGNLDYWINAVRSQIWGMRAWADAHPEFELPIVAPSMVYAENWQRIGDVTDYVDFANAHPYAGGQPPEKALEAATLQDASKGAVGKTVWATETGYWTGPPYNLPPHPGVSEAAQAAYTLRTYAHNFNVLGPDSRTAIYELGNEWPENDNGESRFGLIRNDYTPKPAYNHLRQLLRYVSDPGPRFDPGEVGDCTVTGAEVRMVPLARRNGCLQLLVWRPVAYDAEPVDVTLTHTTDWPWGIYAFQFRPSTGTVTDLGAPIYSARDRIWKLQLDGNLCVIDVRG